MRGRRDEHSDEVPAERKRSGVWLSPLLLPDRLLGLLNKETRVPPPFPLLVTLVSASLYPALLRAAWAEGTMCIRFSCMALASRLPPSPRTLTPDSLA